MGLGGNDSTSRKLKFLYSVHTSPFESSAFEVKQLFGALCHGSRGISPFLSFLVRIVKRLLGVAGSFPVDCSLHLTPAPFGHLPSIGLAAKTYGAKTGMFDLWCLNCHMVGLHLIWPTSENFFALLPHDRSNIFQALTKLKEASSSESKKS